ncbi:peroxidase-like [Anticarsia gemmatalis]|uniref:peroxidase-like n=1 Tax=Anticarsia gemmatalis TaxID=129554 RepID=UPI003F76B0A6
MLVFTCLLSVVCCVNAIFYDSYTGKTITKEEVQKHDKANTTFWCVNDIQPCDPHEGRRVDGSCNNLHHPVRGATHTPFVRVLPPVFDKNFEPKKAASGNDLPLARYLRTRLISAGSIPDQILTTLAVHFFVFTSADLVSLHDTVNYIQWRPYCCLEKGKTDYMCTPNKIPIDDPVHRFSGVRCTNMTRPETFQTIGCVKNDTSPDRIVSSTPLFDLSMLYGNLIPSLVQRGRLFKGGLLKFEIEDGRVWPPSYKTQANVCYLNQRPKELRCHNTPEDGINTLAGIGLVTIWFWRYHNHIANELAKVNPCWDDDKLFEVARDINIAVYLQIYYYELSPILFGFENLVKDGVITPNGGFRDEYNEHILPQLSLEYPFVLRWAHNLQDGPLKLYDKDGYYLKQVPIVNLTLRSGFFAVDDNIDYATQGSFRQGGAKADYVVDYDISEQGMGPHQHVLDLVTNDIAKNRYFGFPPYVNYREFCFGQKIKSFEDLHGIVDEERIEVLSEVYESVEDLDLLAAIWMEKPMRGGIVPPTFYCLVIDQLKRNMYADRHWYERPNRPKAFTYPQLAEIRKITMARILCDVGDTVTRIQPRAFLRPGYNNQMCTCDYITNMDFNAWKDETCSGHDHPIWSKYL